MPTESVSRRLDRLELEIAKCQDDLRTLEMRLNALRIPKDSA